MKNNISRSRKSGVMYIAYSKYDIPNLSRWRTYGHFSQLRWQSNERSRGAFAVTTSNLTTEAMVGDKSSELAQVWRLQASMNLERLKQEKERKENKLKKIPAGYLSQKRLESPQKLQIHLLAILVPDHSGFSGHENWDQLTHSVVIKEKQLVDQADTLSVLLLVYYQCIFSVLSVL